MVLDIATEDLFSIIRKNKNLSEVISARIMYSLLSAI